MHTTLHLRAVRPLADKALGFVANLLTGSTLSLRPLSLAITRCTFFESQLHGGRESRRAQTELAEQSDVNRQTFFPSQSTPTDRRPRQLLS